MDPVYLMKLDSIKKKSHWPMLSAPKLPLEEAELEENEGEEEEAEGPNIEDKTSR